MVPHNTSDKDFTRTYTMTEGAALQMLIDDIKQLQIGQRENAVETRQGFNSVHKEIAELRQDMNNKTSQHAVEITRLDTQAKMAGRVAGAISGAVTSLAVGAVLLLVRYGVFGG